MIGALNRRATFQAPAAAADGGGGFAAGWEDVVTLWVRLEPLTGRDVYGPARLESRNTCRLTLRRHPAIAAGQRAQIGARLFAVHNVLDDGPQSPTLTLMCEEIP